jgi:hypothetical protein
MAATGFTPIQLYRTTTASAVPVNTNLADGELAINTTDEKLYFKNAAGTVKLLAANITPVANGGTGQTTYTNGQLLIGNTTGNTLTKATLTAGTGISITNGAGSISIAASGAALSGVTDSASPFETALGYQAGNVTTGVNNTWVGYEAGLLTTSGTGNTAVGFRALDANITGIGITAIGSNALGSTTVGETTAVGFQALTSNATGLQNSAFGYSALNNNTTGASNNAFGRATSYSNTTGSYNNAFGSSALFNNIVGDSNVAIGHATLSGATGSNNTAIGTFAGTALTTGSNNIIVGYSAEATSATVSNEFTHGNSSITSNRFWGDMKMAGANAGSSGQVLTSAGAGAAPTWATPSGVADSQVIITGGNGYGSTNTKIRRFTTTQTSTGSDITYADSATLGGSFTINTAGLYAIYTTDRSSTASQQMGASLNMTSGTSDLGNLSATQILMYTTTNSATSINTSASRVVRLAVNDVVRAQSAGTLTGIGAETVVFAIIRVG